MIKLYTSQSCASCVKVKNWFKKHNLPYIEKNISFQKLTKEDIKNILNKTENGTEDIVSKRAKIIVNNNIDLDSMSTDEFIKFILENPSALKRPIAIEGNKIQVGYHKEKIRKFIQVNDKLRKKLHDYATF